MRTLPQDEPSIAEQAARWVGTLERGGEAERAAFVSWLRASPQHVREFLAFSALEKEIGELDLGEFNVERILSDTDLNVLRWEGKNQEEIAPVPSLSPGKRGSARKKWSVGIAAAICAAVAGWWTWLGPGAWQSYATAIGEQRTFELEDGSVVELNPLSRIRVRLNEQARDIELRGGEALFKVERDPTRPFRVRSGDTIVRAVGTQFTVHRRTGSVTVSVIEGRVEVSRAEEPLTLPAPRKREAGKEKRFLDAGEEIKIAAGGQTIARRIADPAQMNIRRQRSLTFSGDALADIAEDFNRYNRDPQIRIEGKALRERQFSGVFDVDDPDSLIAYLAQDERLEFEKREGTIVVRQR